MPLHYTHCTHTLLTQLFTSNSLFPFHSTHTYTHTKHSPQSKFTSRVAFPSPSPIPQSTKSIKGTAAGLGILAKEENYIIHMLVQGE